jgi:hypothetical protein
MVWLGVDCDIKRLMRVWLKKMNLKKKQMNEK